MSSSPVLQPMPPSAETLWGKFVFVFIFNSRQVNCVETNIYQAQQQQDKKKRTKQQPQSTTATQRTKQYHITTTNNLC